MGSDSRKVKVAMVSNGHVHADGYAHSIMSHPGAEIVAAWDEDAERGKKWAEKLGCSFYEDYDKMLQEADIDAVAVCSPTSMHKELILKAANAKKHIFTEKILCFTKEDCLEVEKAVRENGIKFMISFPHKCRGDIAYAKQLVDNGVLGKLTYARLRNAHDGSTADWLPEYFYDKALCGGGAMIDLGAHGMYLVPYFLGRPKKFTSIFTEATNRGVEDNAVTVMEFADGAIGVSETGFVASCDPFTLDLAGTKGTLQIRNGLRYSTKETERKWIEVPEEKLPEKLPEPCLQWVDCILEDKEPLFGIKDAIELTEMMEGAYGSIQ